ncbi:hypothetical protein F4776DRAFT_650114 [Hypoxylon sp. NC0597]|nr:hypothetical protein F4776DRAFT_650114 [Hypoxylon sp. NC0597]
MSSQRTHDQGSSHRRGPRAAHRCDDPQKCSYCRRKAIAEERRVNGMCTHPRCSNPPKAGRDMCEHHLNEKLRWYRENYEKKRQERCCVRCPNKLAPEDNILCKTHAAQMQDYTRRRKEGRQRAREEKKIQRQAQQVVSNPTHGNQNAYTHTTARVSTYEPNSGPYSGIAAPSAGTTHLAPNQVTGSYGSGYSQHRPRDMGQYGSSNSSQAGPSSSSIQQQGYYYYPPQNQHNDDIPWSDYIHDDAWE